MAAESNGAMSRSRQVFEFLRSGGCCSYCALRHLGERDRAAYGERMDFVLRQKGLTADEAAPEDGEPPSKQARHATCIACLGMLQEPVIVQTVEKVAQDVLRADYDCASFGCALTLPVCLALRSHTITLALRLNFPGSRHDDVTPLKEAWKWSVASRVASAIGKQLDSGTTCGLLVEIFMSYVDDAKETQHLLPPGTANRKAALTRRSVASQLDRASADTLALACHWPPPPPTQPMTCERVVCNQAPIFLAGRYTKTSRALSQTPWLVDGERKMDSSVQEILCEPLLALACADGVKFSSSGREDVDVRMLGLGRPVCLEMCNPRRTRLDPRDLATATAVINENQLGVRLTDLQLMPKTELGALKDGEESKTKRYLALVRCTRALDEAALDALGALGRITLSQRTPIRVLHRRPLATRSRWVDSLSTRIVRSSSEGCVFALSLRTQAGTYVKEFVHGDLGRTQPALGQLLNADVDILALDVQEINLDWPPALDT